MDSLFFQQGREAASRLVHTQDVTGSSPVPATSFGRFQAGYDSLRARTTAATQSRLPKDNSPPREGGQVRLARPPVPAGNGDRAVIVKDHRSAARHDRRAGRACYRAPFRCRSGQGPP